MLQVYQKAIAAIIKKAHAKSWNSKQVKLYRTLHNCTRQMTMAAKEYERGLEVLMRRTSNLKSGITKFASDDLSWTVKEAARQLRSLSELAERVNHEGHEQRFNMACLHRVRVRKILKPKHAKAAYKALMEAEMNKRYSMSGLKIVMLLNKWMRKALGRPMSVNQMDVLQRLGSAVKYTRKPLLEEWHRQGRVILTSKV